jgi:lysophospholipase L1-like esterase
MRKILIKLTLGAGLVCAAAAQPVIHLLGDSTVRNGTPGQQGWGDSFARHIDPARAGHANHAIGGRSSRTFHTEGRWQAVRKRLRKGDVVIMQFGHNDGGPVDSGRARASLKGTGQERREVTLEATGRTETVCTYGWYLRKIIRETREAGAVPLVLSPVPRNIWRKGRIARASGDYGKWAGEAARQAGAFFIDLNERVALAYETLGQKKTARFFTGGDQTHTNAAGAGLSAAVLAAAIEQERLHGVAELLLPGRGTAAAELARP